MGVHPGIAEVDVAREPPSCFTSGEQPIGKRQLTRQLGALATDGELREYVMAHHIVLYARIKDVVYLLSIRHQRQLSFDFQALWLTGR